MLFEVWKDGKRMMWTESEEAIPDKEALRMMIEAGYEPRLDGKPYKPKRKSKSKKG